MRDILDERQEAPAGTDLLDRLESALREHVAWLLQVNRLLLGDKRPKEEDIRPDSHLRCTFGEWLHGERPGWQGIELGSHALAALHRDLHVRVRDCLMRRRCRQDIDLAAFEALSDSAMRFSNAVRTLQAQIAGGMSRRAALASPAMASQC
jgi:hypothetical protein